MLGVARVGGAAGVGAQRLRTVIASAGLNGAPEAVRRLTMSWMPSSGAPATTGRSELPGQHQPGVEQRALPVQPRLPVRARRRRACRRRARWRTGPGGTGMTPSAAARATWSGRARGEVLDPVPGVRGAGTGAAACVERVEGQVDRAVADRVRGDLPAGPVRGDDRGGQLVGVGLQVAAVARLARRSRRDMAAVRPTSDPSVKIFIGPIRSQSSPKPVRSPRSRPISMPSSGCAASGCKRVAGDHQLDADVQPALLAGG